MTSIEYLNMPLPYDQGEGVYSHGDELLQMLSDGYMDEAFFIIDKEYIHPKDLEDYLKFIKAGDGDQEFKDDQDLVALIHKLKRIAIITDNDDY